MSSETSIDAAVPKRPAVAARPGVSSAPPDSDALQPWQLFTLAGLAGATAVVFVAKDTGPAGVILLSITVAASAWLGLAAWRTLAPLFGFHGSTTTEVLGGRTRAALEREKVLVLRAIKDLEFDRAMGKVADKDFADMSLRLRNRAAMLIRQLDRGAGYRDEIEQEIARRTRATSANTAVAGPVAAAVPSASTEGRTCTCGAANDVDARFCKNCGSRLVAACLALLLLAPALVSAQVAMPDPTQIAGMAIPAPELPNGTVSVRLVREQLGNNIAGHEITVKAGSVTKTARTDESGRATFTGLPERVQATAETVVDGEPLVSKPFDVPHEGGGIRVILISGLQNVLERRKKEQAESAAAPPTKGIVIFGGDTRIIFEFQDDTLRGFYLLDIVNTARTRVDVGGPLVIDLPAGAGGATVMEGSFPGATVRGDRVTIAGPFPAGTSSVQIGFTLPYSGSELTIAQKFPAALERINVILEKVGAVHLASPQFTNHGEAKADDGTPFMIGNGGSVAAGQPLTLQLSGLPSHSTWPRDIALGLAALIVGVGAWLAFAGRATADEQRRRLQARRDALYAELVKLEEQHRSGRIDASRYHSKRHHLVTELERVYGELDGGGEAAA